MPKFHSMTRQTPNDRRKFPRSRLRIPCQLQLPEADHPGFVLDLGRTFDDFSEFDTDSPFQVSLAYQP